MLLSTKLKNLITKASKDKDVDLEFYFKNILVNGQKRGCSGFVKNKKNGLIVYVDTERSVLSSLKNYVCRYADNIKDYTGYRNRWCDTPEQLVSNICDLLTNPNEKARDIRKYDLEWALYVQSRIN